MLSIIEAYKSGLLHPRHWMSNLMAGSIVGIVALPLAMAFAIASGVKPEQGLYTAIVAGFFVGVFGGSRVQIAGPTGAFIVILAGITAHYGVEGLQVASLMAGCFLLFMGLFRLGHVVQWVPSSVIVGFTAGIGMIIFVGQWKSFFGLSVSIPLDAHFHQSLFLLLKALPHFHLATTCLALLSLFLILVTPFLLKQLPGALIAMVIVTLLQSIFHWKGVATLGSTFGNIPQHLPHFQWFSITGTRLLELLGPAFSIALLGAIESLLSASAADRLAGTQHHSNQELIGQGLANIFSPLLGGFAATGAIARTATNIRHGGTSPLAALVHCALLLMILLLLAPLANHIPLCTLAAILFVVAYKMSDVPHFLHLLKTESSRDNVVLILTFLLTLFVNLILAVIVGILLKKLFTLKKSLSTTPFKQND